MVRGTDESPQGAGDGISDAEGGSVYGVVVRWRQGEMKPVESSLNKLFLFRRRDEFAR